MPAWLMSAVRTAVQSGWGVLAAWLLARGVDVPDEMPAWVVGAALVAATGVWTAMVRWLETRRWRPARTLARWLMLGIVRQPVGYATPTRLRPAGPGGLYRADGDRV